MCQPQLLYFKAKPKLFNQRGTFTTINITLFPLLHIFVVKRQLTGSKTPASDTVTTEGIAKQETRSRQEHTPHGRQLHSVRPPLQHPQDAEGRGYPDPPAAERILGGALTRCAFSSPHVLQLLGRDVLLTLRWRFTAAQRVWLWLGVFLLLRQRPLAVVLSRGADAEEAGRPGAGLFPCPPPPLPPHPVPSGP